jgi:imidazolonepropionase-like amidohydrolase
MKRFICFAVAFLAAAAITSAQNSVIVIRGVTLIDGTGRGSVPNATVVIEGNTITDVGPQAKAPAGARTIDGTGKYLIPGMIDAHIHLRGGRGGAPAAEQERDGIRALHSYLYAGVTSVFDV